MIDRIGVLASKISNAEQNDDDEKLNEILRKRKKEESFDLKYLAFILVDLIPYERKAEMIAGFEKLFSLPSTGRRMGEVKDQIMDISEGGLSGFTAPLGNIHNAKKLAPLRKQPIPSRDGFIYDSGVVKADLPDVIDWIEVSVSQDVKFCYYVHYFCYINRDFWVTNRDTYVHSGDIINKLNYGREQKGPRSDLTFQKYEKEVALFLTKYTNGLYLNKEYSHDKAIPSIRILSTPSIDFANLISWRDRHWLFLQYSMIERFYSKYQASIISLQSERIFQKSNMSKGITIIYSEKDIPIHNSSGDVYHRILSNASVINASIMDYFLPLYWSNYNIYLSLETWKIRLKKNLSEIKSGSLTEEQLEKKVSGIINLFGDFAVYSSDEKINIRTARNNFNVKKHLVGKSFLYPGDSSKPIVET